MSIEQDQAGKMAAELEHMLGTSSWKLLEKFYQAEMARLDANIGDIKILPDHTSDAVSMEYTFRKGVAAGSKHFLAFVKIMLTELQAGRIPTSDEASQ